MAEYEEKRVQLENGLADLAQQQAILAGSVPSLDDFAAVLDERLEGMQGRWEERFDELQRGLERGLEEVGRKVVEVLISVREVKASGHQIELEVEKGLAGLTKRVIEDLRTGRDTMTTLSQSQHIDEMPNVGELPPTTSTSGKVASSVAIIDDFGTEFDDLDDVDEGFDSGSASGSGVAGPDISRAETVQEGADSDGLNNHVGTDSGLELDYSDIMHEHHEIQDDNANDETHNNDIMQRPPIASEETRLYEHEEREQDQDYSMDSQPNVGEIVGPMIEQYDGAASMDVFEPAENDGSQQYSSMPIAHSAGINPRDIMPLNLMASTNEASHDVQIDLEPAQQSQSGDIPRSGAPDDDHRGVDVADSRPRFWRRAQVQPRFAIPSSSC